MSRYVSNYVLKQIFTAPYLLVYDFINVHNKIPVTCQGQLLSGATLWLLQVKDNCAVALEVLHCAVPSFEVPPKLLHSYFNLQYSHIVALTCSDPMEVMRNLLCILW